MNRMGALYQMALADFRERSRRYSFLVTMLGVLFFGYLVITGKYTIQFGDCRTLYDSAWAGSLMAVCSSIMLVFAGFYLVKGSIGRDRHTGVGQILAATPVSRLTIIISKFISNVALLWLMVVILAVMAMFTLLFKIESGSIELSIFLSPFLLITMPAMVFVAAVAVLFDTVRWLRGGIGNIIYLFLAEALMVMGILEAIAIDLGGISVFVGSIRQALELAYPGEKMGLQAGFIGLGKEMQVENYRLFAWKGIEWTTIAIMFRLAWVGAALAVTSLTAVLFDRYDPAGTKIKETSAKTKSARAKSPNAKSEYKPAPGYASLKKPEFGFSFRAMVLCELRLATKGFNRFWYLVAIALLVAQIVVPFDIARKFLTPAIMIWPLVIWSSMGSRERRYNTGMLLFSSPHSVTRQFPAIWLAGFAVALMAVGAMVVRAVGADQWLYAAALLMGALLIPSVSLVMGTVSGSRKLFEVIYPIIWYVGSIDGISVLDILGTTGEAVSVEKLLVLGFIAAMSLMSAFFFRRVQAREH